MITNVFALIQLLLRLIGLWDQFQSWNDAQKLKEAEEKRQARDKAIEDAKAAQTADDAFKAQTGVVDNEP